MFRLVSVICVLLFMAACGGGGVPSETLQEVPSRADALIQANPTFFESNVLILPHGGTAFSLGKTTCNVDGCEIDDQETSLAELLFAKGFKHTETRRGVDLGRESLQHFEGEILRYGGWLDHSVFAVHSGTLTDGEPETHGYAVERIIRSYSVGVPEATNPVSGSVSWIGVMVAADVSQTDAAGNFIQGNATLTVDFARILEECERWGGYYCERRCAGWGP